MINEMFNFNKHDCGLILIIIENSNVINVQFNFINSQYVEQYNVDWLINKVK